MNLRRLVHLSSLLKIKQILEIDGGRIGSNAYFYTTEIVDNPKEVVLPEDYEAGKNVKLPLAAIEFNSWDPNIPEMGGFGEKSDFWVDIQSVNDGDAMDASDIVNTRLFGQHYIWNFNEWNGTPDFNDLIWKLNGDGVTRELHVIADDSILTMPTEDLGVFTLAVGDASTIRLKIEDIETANFVKRYSYQITGTIQYDRVKGVDL
jgi:hypothetical protein